jgi:hypothetical protein
MLYRLNIITSIIYIISLRTLVNGIRKICYLNEFEGSYNSDYKPTKIDIDRLEPYNYCEYSKL